MEDVKSAAHALNVRAPCLSALVLCVSYRRDVVVLVFVLSVRRHH